MLRWILLSGVLAAAPVVAAAETANVVTQAEDAFGERAGLERIGLYSETQVRGFSLATAGNYRIDGAYYVPQQTLPNPLIGGVITRVGWNALGADFPAPSGIVEFRLRSALPGARLTVEAGLVQNGGNPYLDLEGSAATVDGRWGISGGLTARPHSRWFDGVTLDRSVAVGIVPEWRPDAATSVKLFASGFYEDYPGDFAFKPTGARLPPRVIDYPGRYQAGGAEWQVQALNAGVIAKTRRAGWDLQSSAIYSWLELSPSDFAILSADEHGFGRGVGLFTHAAISYSLSGEVKASRRFGEQRIFAMFRARETRQRLPLPDVVDLGPFDIRYPTPVSSPSSSPTRRFEDLARQVTGGLGYETRLGDRLQLRFGIQRTRYEKTVTQNDGFRSGNLDRPWLWDAAAVLRVSGDVTVFVTATRGLEESGSAPTVAANRYEVLPAVTAQQYEVGVRARLTPRVSLIGSAFQVTKPTPSFGAGNVYGLFGSERHRGLELSLTGQVARGLSAVLGAVAIDPDLQVAGQATQRPLGVSSFMALASFNYEVRQVKGLSLDGALNHSSRQLISATGLEIPSLTTLALGGRYQFNVGEQPATLRIYASNLLNAKQWSGSKSGLIWPTFPRAIRATVSTTFD